MSNIETLKYTPPLHSAKVQKNIEEVEACPLCSSKQYVKTRTFDIDKIINDWIEQRGYNPVADTYRHKILIQKRCIECGLYYYNYHLHDTLELYDLLSQKNYYPHFRDEFGVAAHFIKDIKPRNLLEVGCGSGNFLLYIKNVVPDSYGCETSSRAISLCKQKGVKNVIESSTENIEKKFDVVCHFELIEHIFEIKTFLENNIQLLNPNGHLIIGTPNPEGIMSQIDYDILDLPPHHQFLLSKQTLTWIAEKYNLNLSKYATTELDSYRFEMYKKTHKECISLNDLKGKICGDTHIAVFSNKK